MNLYDEGTNRKLLVDALNKALGKKIAETAPKVKDKTGTWVRSPVKYELDEVNYSEYTTPEIVVFNPKIKKAREFTLNEKVYRDLDYDNLTAKEYAEPIPVNITFKVHTAARNPDSDLAFADYLIKMENTISYLDAEIVKDSGIYDRHQVVWKTPKDFDSTDIAKVREISGSVFAWLEINDYKEVRLLAPGDDGIDVEREDFESTKYYLFAKTAQGIYKTDVSIQTKGSLVGFPISGTVMIENDVVTYTSRTKYEFLGVSGITRFHNFDTKIEVVGS